MARRLKKVIDPTLSHEERASIAAEIRLLRSEYAFYAKAPRKKEK